LHKLNVAKSDEHTIAIGELTRVHGIGPKLAKKLVNEEKIKSVEQLRQAFSKKKVKLTNQQEIGLKYFDEMEQKIPRDELTKFEEIIFDMINQVDANIIKTICGSYRRGLDKSGDIDLLITQPKSSSKSTDKYTVLKRVVEKLTKEGLIKDIVGHGETKFSGIVKLPDSVEEFKPHIHRRMDSMFCFSSTLTSPSSFCYS
jgi:DNA polymerase beta